jgi:hypothetical protein
MTSTVTTTPIDDHERARRAVVPTGIAAVAVAATLSITQADSTGEWIFEVVLQLVVGALVFGLVVPRGLRHEVAGKRALVMAVLAVLIVVPAFWLGLTPLLGAAAVLLGYAGRRASRGAGWAVASLVLGTLAVLAYLAIYVGDYLHTHAG